MTTYIRRHITEGKMQEGRDYFHHMDYFIYKFKILPEA